MIKKALTIMAPLLFLVFGLVAQTNTIEGLTEGQKSGPVKLTIGTESGTPGLPLTIPINAANFSGHSIGSITLKIGFDQNKLSVTGIIPHQNQSGWSMTASAGIITITNYSVNNPITNGLLLELSCIYHGIDIVDITFKPGTEITNSEFVPLMRILTNGKVIPAIPPETLSIGQVITPVGTTLTVPVVASNFGDANIGAITLKIGFPEGILSFSGLTTFQGFTGSSSNSSNQITFIWNNISGQQLNDGLLLELTFVYLEEQKANIVFNPGVQMVRIDNSIIPVQYVSGFVNTMPDGYNISGVLKYANEAGTLLSNSTVELWDEDGENLIETSTTDADGFYEFIGIVPGDYVLKASTTKPRGGIDVDDLWDLFDYLDSGLPELTGIYLLAADFNQNGVVNVDDLWDLFDALDSNFSILPDNYIEWVFENPFITIIGTDVTIDIHGLCVGDVNGSYIPSP